MAREHRRPGGRGVGERRQRRVRRVLPPELRRIAKRLGGLIGSIRRWESYYRKRYEETRAEIFREKARAKARERMRLETIYEALKKAGWDNFAWGVAETWRSMIDGTLRPQVPGDVPDWLREYLEIGVAHALANTTWAGPRRTGWPAFVDCAGDILDALKKTRPSDRARFYAYIELEDEENYWDAEREEMKTTDVITVHIGDSRIDEADWNELSAAALKAASDLAQRTGLRIRDVCVAIKPAV